MPRKPAADSSTYDAAGVAHLYCPDLFARMGKLHHDSPKWHALSAKEKLKIDGGGHRSFTFVWVLGDFKLSHPANGGIPQCSCGKTLIHVAGDDPF